MKPQRPRSPLFHPRSAKPTLLLLLAALAGLAAGLGEAAGPRPPRAAAEPGAAALGLARGADQATASATATPGAGTPSPSPGGPNDPTATAQATAGQPNLVPVSGAWRETGAGDQRRCVSPSGPPGGLFVCVANQGDAPAGPFALADDVEPGSSLAQASGLLAGETLCLILGIAPDRGVVVDPGAAVAESSEDDNWLPPVPVPPEGMPRPTCEPTATPAAGTPTAEPGPAAELLGYGWLWNEFPYGCMRPEDPWQTRSDLLIANDGNADAPAFRVAQQSDGATIWALPDLPAGATRRRDALRSAQPFVIDADNAVREQDETNNTFYPPVPTLVPTCTPGPSPTPIPRPEIVLERAEVRAMGFDARCVVPPIRVQVHVRVANRGTGFAEGITVEADGYRPGWSIRRLAPGEHSDLAPVDPPLNWVRARPLMGDDPANNSRHVVQVTLTPPPLCTPSPTPGPAGRSLLPWAGKH